MPARRRVKLPDLWSSFPILRVIAYRDLAARFKQAALGPLWLFVQPLGIVAAFAVAFNGVTKVNTSGVPYVLFALTGTCVWTYFQLSLSTGANAIVANGTFIRRVNLPRHTLPMAQLIVAFPVLGATLIFTFIAIAALGQPVSWRLALLPLAFVWLAVLTWSIVALISAIGVRIRDLLNLIPFVLQVGLFVTPIGYPSTQAGSAVQKLIDVNPLTGVISAWRWCLLPRFSFEVLPVLIAVGWTVVVAVAGWWIFTRLEVTFADVA